MYRKYRQIKRGWRRFYRAHREVLDTVGDFLGALSIFVFLYELYILLWLLQG